MHDEQEQQREQGGASGMPEERAPAAHLAAVTAAVAALRQSVEGTTAPVRVDLTTLAGLVETVVARTGRSQSSADRLTRLALLDEVELLVGALEREHGALAEQLRAATRHRRAGSAYGSRGVAP